MMEKQRASANIDERIEGFRPQLLRHCYRMLGSFSDAEDLVQEVMLRAWKARHEYAEKAPLEHWLMRIATNACLNEIASQRRRRWPPLDVPASNNADRVELRDVQEWLTPAPDQILFPAPAQHVELRESVSLAFLALLQTLPPRQRAVLLLSDVMDWSAAEVASALEISVGSVNSALHRARRTTAVPARGSYNEPDPSLLQEYIDCWEGRDVERMIALLREDIVFSMPPHSTWFRGQRMVAEFLRGELFSERWSSGFRVITTRANGQLALAFYRGSNEGFLPSSLQMIRVMGQEVAEIVSFVGPGYLRGFELPPLLLR